MNRSDPPVSPLNCPSTLEVENRAALLKFLRRRDATSSSDDVASSRTRMHSVEIGGSAYGTRDLDRLLRQSLRDLSLLESMLPEAPSLSLPLRRVSATTPETRRYSTAITANRYNAPPKPPKSPPASYQAIQRMPRLRLLPSDKEFLEDNCAECAICCDRLADGFLLVRLPCGHSYHHDCAASWLRENCTCPECRYELPTEDKRYESGRMERMKSRKVVQCSCGSGGHGPECFFPTSTQ